MPKDIPAHELPSANSVGNLEPVAFFNDAMPTGVTVSHKGRIFVNFPQWGDDVKFTVAEITDGNMVAYPDESINQTNQEDLASTLDLFNLSLLIQQIAYGFLTLEALCLNLLNMEDQNWFVWI